MHIMPDQIGAVVHERRQSKVVQRWLIAAVVPVDENKVWLPSFEYHREMFG
jgi:hypothetical protein